MIKIDVFDKINDLSHTNSFYQLFHCRESIISTMDVVISSTFVQKMLSILWLRVPY